MGLRKYFTKRNFQKTPEPTGGKASSKKLAFVIQKHHASHLHYDFRLELDGVLKSWAVPKGPSTNPHDRRLAMMVEDHPFDYRKFEGVIPQGNYGAGNVIIWDQGWYEPRATSSNPVKLLRQELKQGHLTIVMHGQKLKGEYALIKLQHGEENAWLLIKKDDEFASTADITKLSTSVKSGRQVDDLGGKAPDVSAYPKSKPPKAVKPMLCTLVDEPFSRDGWLFEMKWDGYRAISSKVGQDVELYSRNLLDFSQKYPPVVEALRELKPDVVLDGEIVVVDDDGNSHFEWLQNWHRQPRGHLCYYVFDVLWYNGHNVQTMPLLQRKILLQSLVPASSLIRYSDHVEDSGLELFKKVQQQGFEGMVAKQADSPYRQGDRGAAWLKIKTHLRQEVVIGGFTEPRGSRTFIGSLLVGVYQKGKLVYVGHSGGGIPDDQRQLLQRKLLRLERKSSPFRTEPKPNAPVHWVRPELVCEMSFAEWTSEGYMRQPQFKGLRPDKKATAVHREKPQNQVKPAPQLTNKPQETPMDRQLELTHLDKIFFPKPKYTKGDLVDYYKSVANYILPYLQDRPCSLLRQPDGVADKGFFQKNMEHLPAWVPSADIFSESNNKDLHWIKGGNLDTLLYMVQLGCIEINPWNSRVPKLDYPDWIVIDLDPEGVGFDKVIQVAQTVRQVSNDWGVPAYPKTSGKTGIHIYIPLGAKYSYEQAKNFAHLFAIEVNKRQPKLTSVERMPVKRPHKIYVDFLQNRQGQTLAAPYSVRPTPTATVSTPLHWDEVKPGLRPTDFTIKNTAARLKKAGDLWKPVLGPGINLAKVLQKIKP